MAVKARDDVTLAAVTDIANVRRYYLLQGSALNPPAAPTVNPAPAPWVTSEPTYTEGSTNSLYTVDLTVFTDGSFDYSTVSKSSSYEAAKSAFNKAVAATNTANAALAAVPPFVQQATPSATVAGQLWFPLDAAGNVIGMKRSTSTGTAGWVDYLWMAGSILVPGSVGTISMGDSTVTAPKIYATAELWAKILNVAGDATIGGNLLAQNIVGKTLLGAYIEGGEILMRGQSGTPTTLFSDTFTTTTTQALSNVRIKETWGSATARNGWCAEASILANPGTTTSGRTGNALLLPTATWDDDRDGWFSVVQTGAMGSPSTSGDKTLSLWVKPIVVSTAGGYTAPSTATVTATAYITNGTTTSTAAATVQAAFGSWTQVSIPIPSGWTLVTPALPNTHTMRVTIRPDSDPTGSQEMTWQVAIDDVTITRSADVNSNVHIYRNTSGAPTIDISDINAKVRVRLTAPIDGGASLSFFDTSGNAVTLDDTGVTQTIYQQQAETTPWSQILSGPAAGKREGSGSTSTTNGNWATYAMVSSTDNVTGGITVSGYGLAVSRDGLYAVTGVVRFSPNTSGRRGVQLTVNNTQQTLTQRFLPPASNNTMPVAVSDMLQLSKGDVVRVQGFQDAGSLSMTGGGLSLALVATL